jgi:hypothetical protein
MLYEHRGPEPGIGILGSVVESVDFEKRQRAKKPSAACKSQLQAAKRAFTTRRVDLNLARGLVVGGGPPKAGDLVLARVEQIGHHARLELPDGRRSALYVGDEIIVAYGARYAPDQFEAVVPDDLSMCDLVAGGGVAGQVIARHSKTRAPTRIQPIGLLADRNGRALNLSRFALPETMVAWRPTVIAVCGTSMNAGKTTTAAHLIKGLRRSGLRVGATKVTGTGSGGDVWSMADAGAQPVYDFTDMGHATTFKVEPEELERIALQLINHLSAARAEVVVLEIADGLFQTETAALLSSPAFSARIDAVVFAAGDAMGAAFGVDWLRRRNLPVVAVSGVVTASPLGREEAIAATGLPVVHINQLSDGAQVTQIVFSGAAAELSAVAP